jgi:DNA-binding NtrC family response regulator
MDRSATILVFADNTAVLDLIEQTLSAAGHRVLTTGDAAEALEVARSIRIDLLISDVVFGAAALARQLQEIQAGIRVLYIFDADHPEPVETGSSGFLRKPLSLADLGPTVTAVLQAG